MRTGQTHRDILEKSVLPSPGSRSPLLNHWAVEGPVGGCHRMREAQVSWKGSASGDIPAGSTQKPASGYNS